MKHPHSIKVPADKLSTLLVGYKGISSIDTAAFYCPYVPLTKSGTVIDPKTFEPVIEFVTRYGKTR